MYYKHPPIYKYIILLILITTFLKYYKVITKENYLLISSVFTYMVFIFDYVLIEEHPNLFNDSINIDKKVKEDKTKCKKKKEKIKSKKIKVIDDINKQKKHIIYFNDSKEENDIDDLDKELEDLDESLNNKNNLNDTDDNLTEEIQKELDELDL